MDLGGIEAVITPQDVENKKYPSLPSLDPDMSLAFNIKRIERESMIKLGVFVTL